MTIVEALSQGVPVVASRVGGIPEIIDGATTGLFAEPANSEDLAAQICRLLSDRNFAERIGETGQRFVKSHFSRELMVEKTQGLYMRVLGL
jgi:glycosyltransferase involved in cell wall biosynthesis